MHLIPEASTVMALANLANLGVVGEDEVGTNSEDYYVLGESVISIAYPSIFCRGGWI